MANIAPPPFRVSGCACKKSPAIDAVAGLVARTSGTVTGRHRVGAKGTPDEVFLGAIGGWLVGTGAGAYYGYTLSGGGGWGIVVAALLTAPIGGTAGAVAGGALGRALA